MLGLGWLGPLVDHTVGHGLGQGPRTAPLDPAPPITTAMILRRKGGDGFADAGLRARCRANRPW